MTKHIYDPGRTLTREEIEVLLMGGMVTMPKDIRGGEGKYVPAGLRFEGGSRQDRRIK